MPLKKEPGFSPGDEDNLEENMVDRAARYMASLSEAGARIRQSAGRVFWSGANITGDAVSGDNLQDNESHPASAPPDPDDDVPLLRNLQPAAPLSPPIHNSGNTVVMPSPYSDSNKIKTEVNDSPELNSDNSMVPVHENSHLVNFGAQAMAPPEILTAKNNQLNNLGAQATAPPETLVAGDNQINNLGAQNVIQSGGLNSYNSIYPSIDYSALGARPKDYSNVSNINVVDADPNAAVASDNTNLTRITESVDRNINGDLSIASSHSSTFNGFLNVSRHPPAELNHAINSISNSLDQPPSYSEACLSPAAARAQPIDGGVPQNPNLSSNVLLDGNQDLGNHPPPSEFDPTNVRMLASLQKGTGMFASYTLVSMLL